MSYKVIILIGLILISGMLFGAEKYAVLITGDYADERGNFDGSWAQANGNDITRSAMEEFWHDTFLMWELLINQGYSNENIFVLFADGIDFQDQYILEGERYVVHPDYAPITDYEANLANVEMVLQGLANGNPHENIPQLQDDDFLVIWTFDHGAWHSGHRWLCLLDGEISDEAFGILVDQINCQKKVVFMQQCFSGGFVPFLENEHSIVFTAANDHMWAFRNDNLYFDGIDFPGDPNPGNSYWAYERDIWAGHHYPHGEYNYHLFNALKFETPDYASFYHTDYGDFPLNDADLNEDGICSIYESTEWVKEFNSRQRQVFWPHWDDPQYSDVGNIGETTSLEYPNILLDDITTTQTIKGIIAVPFDLTISGGAVLTIADNSKIHLLNQAQLSISEGASIMIGDNVLFRGENMTIPGDETNPEIPGNRIEVYGDIVIGNDVQFLANDGEYWDGLYLYEGSTVTFNNPTFTNCNLISEETPLVINGGVFTNSWLEQSGHDIEIDSTNFVDSFIRAQDYTFRQCSFVLENSAINNSSTETAVMVSTFWDYLIHDNVISSNGTALDISKSGKGRNRFIYDNVIDGNLYGYGIFLFNSYADIIGSNVVTNKNVGIVGINKSQINLFGNTEIPFQQIHHNNLDELIFTHDSFPYRFRYNQIFDDNHDNYLLKCAEHFQLRPHDVTYNYWGNIFDPLLDFYPADAFIFEPIWDPGGRLLSDAELLFIQAQEYEEAENYALAEQSYKSIIESYPEDDFAAAAAKELLALTSKSSQNYADLKTYYNSEPNILNDEELNPLAGALSNYCEVGLQEYDTAIDYFEALIANAATLQDSISAVLELGYTYLLMENNGRSNYVGKFTELKPKSAQDFEKNRSELLSILWGNAEEGNQESEIPQAVALFANYPNPFNPETTISFSIPNDSNINLAIFNIKGQKVQTVANDAFDGGMHKVVWNGKDQNNKSVASGVYFYKLEVNGKTEAVKKCLLLK